MSGHSHFASIKHKKAITDTKRGNLFSKLTKAISVAAREKGGDPDVNSKLRLAIEQAKEANMPSDNIERAIKKGTGELEAEKLEEVLFEAYGPSGIAIIIEGITDNKNRTLGEIKQILAQHNSKLASEGSVKWLFKRMGCITLDYNSQTEELKDKEKLQLTVIEAGAEDIYWHNEILDVYTKPEDLEKIKKTLEEKEVKIRSASLDWVAQEEITLSDDKRTACQKLFEDLDESDAVQEIYANLKV